DVKPYIQQTDTEWITVELPSEMKQIQFCIKTAIESRYDELRRTGLSLSNSRSLSELLRVREFVLWQNRRAAKPLFTAIRLIHALNILEYYCVISFIRFCYSIRQ